MARRSRHRNKKEGSLAPILLAGIGAAVALLGGALFIAFNSKPGKSAHHAESTFSISDYRSEASRLTGNTYQITGRVESIETQGNVRIVAISIPDNMQERLPLLVPQGITKGVNLTRGDRFVFDVVCCNGMDDGQEVKGIMVVRHVETK